MKALSHCAETTLLAVAAAWLAACGVDDGPTLVSGDAVEFVHANRGNEIVVAKEGRRFRLRLAGVYTFHPGAIERRAIAQLARDARTAVEEHVRGAAAGRAFERDERDRRRRYIGYLEAGGEDVGLRLIREGLGVVYTEYPFSREPEYAAAEASTRRADGSISTGVAVRRARALRETWAAVRKRQFGAAPSDRLLLESP